MTSTRTCQARNERGETCRQAPLMNGDYCFWHSPDHREEAAEARRLGGLRRRRERTVASAYDVEGLGSAGAVRRLLEIAVMDTLGSENSIARARTLAYLAQVALRMLEVEELEQRLATLETAVLSRSAPPPSPFDVELDDTLGLTKPEEAPS